MERPSLASSTTQSPTTPRSESRCPCDCLPVTQLRRASRPAQRTHRHRNPNLGPRRNKSADEPRRRYSDHSEALVIERNIFTDQLRIAAESPLPEIIAEHCYRTGARRAIFFEGKRAPLRHRHAQNVKVVPCDKFTHHYLAAFAGAECEHRPIDSCYTREDMIAVAVIQVLGIRKRVAAAITSNHGEESVVIGSWQPAPEKCLSQTEDRHIYADPKAQRQDSHSG